jgi:DeoR/GlpR family transcriptional regulator of sugar metabolism
MSMIPEERRSNIIIKLKENGYLKIDELAEDLKVSRITIIRDIQILRDSGKIKRIHGGIKLSDAGNNSFESRFFIRMQNNYGKKVEIAKKALEFLKGKNTIFLDSSSTVFVFATEIFKNRFEDKNIITNSPAILVEALDHPNVNLISTGGELKQEFNIFGGSWVDEFLENINIDCAFLSAAGISGNLEITTNNKDLAGTLRRVFDKAGEVNLLVDSTKFFKEGMLNIANINECKRIITDSDIVSKIDEKLRKEIHIEIVY